MTANAFSILAGLIFTAVALLQLARALGAIHVEITVGHKSLPIKASWILFAVTAGLALLGFFSAGH